MTTLLLTFCDNSPRCDECYSGAKIVLLFSRQHACGRACVQTHPRAVGESLPPTQREGRRMRLQCWCCHGRLGLGIVSKVVWESGVWGYRRFRFCGVKCRETFMQARQASLDRERAVASLFRHPP
jgi:hypothetical protein